MMNTKYSNKIAIRTDYVWGGQVHSFSQSMALWAVGVLLHQPYIQPELLYCFLSYNTVIPSKFYLLQIQSEGKYKGVECETSK